MKTNPCQETCPSTFAPCTLFSGSIDSTVDGQLRFRHASLALTIDIGSHHPSSLEPFRSIVCSTHCTKTAFQHFRHCAQGSCMKVGDWFRCLGSTSSAERIGGGVGELRRYALWPLGTSVQITSAVKSSETAPTVLSRWDTVAQQEQIQDWPIGGPVPPL